MDYLGIVYGGLAGVGWSILGYAREKQKDTKLAFELTKFIKTVIIGAAIGGYASYAGLTIDIVSTSGFALTATAVVDKIVSIVIGFFTPKKK